MRQLVHMFLIDARLTFKSAMGLYMFGAPLFLLLILRFFLPSVENSGATWAVVSEGPNAVEASMIEALDRYGTVARYDSIEMMERRLRGTGEVEGLYWDPEAHQYVSVLERSIESNTAFSTGARIVRQHSLAQRYPDREPIVSFRAHVPDELADRTGNPPVATIGGAIYIVWLAIICAFLIGLGIINDKEYGTDRAYRVSPVTRTEYFVAKSIVPLLLLLFYSGLALVVLGLTNANLAHLLVAVLLSFAVSLLVGLLVGALTRNENEAIGLIKMIGMVMALGVLGGTLLPDGWQWVAFPIPFYWIFELLQGVFSLTETWASVGLKSLIVLGITSGFFVLLRRRIIAGLS